VLRAYLFVSSLTVIMYFCFLPRDAQRFEPPQEVSNIQS
jgi:hypothetical protein